MGTALFCPDMLFAATYRGMHAYSRRGVLVMYILAGSDPHFMENFKFFLKDAILEDMVADYAVLVQAPVRVTQAGQGQRSTCS